LNSRANRALTDAVHLRISAIQPEPHIDDARAELERFLIEHAYTYDEKGFELASGGRSNEYIDCKRALCYPDALHACGEVVSALLGSNVEAVGGLTMGADPIATATALSSREAGKRGVRTPVRWFSVRKAAKGHGTKRPIEGNLPAGSRVAVVDDVVTKGSSTLEAVMRCREAGHEVVQVVVLVDREQGGVEHIAAELPGVPIERVFTKRELHDGWKAKHGA